MPNCVWPDPVHCGQWQLMESQEQREGKGYTAETFKVCKSWQGPWRQWEYVSYSHRIQSRLKTNASCHCPLSGLHKACEVSRKACACISEREIYCHSFHNWNNARQNEGNTTIQIVSVWRPSYFWSATVLAGLLNGWCRGTPSPELEWSWGAWRAAGAWGES